MASKTAQLALGLTVALSTWTFAAQSSAQPCQPQWSDQFVAALTGTTQAMLTFDDGRGSAVYLAGWFALADPSTPHNGVVRWNGQTFEPLGVSMNSSNVYSLAAFDDGSGGGPAIYAGGDFTSAGSTALARIAKWNGAEWVSLGLGLNGAVRAMTTFDDGTGPALFVAGEFTEADGTSANRIAKWDGTNWTALGTGLNGTVYALTVHDDGNGAALYIGGTFSTAGGTPAKSLARWDGSNWSNVGGELGPSDTFSPAVLTLASFDDGRGRGPMLYVGGGFFTAGGTAARGLARWDGAQWESVGSPEYWYRVQALVPFPMTGHGTELVALGSYFTTPFVSPFIAFRTARWNGQDWTAFGGETLGPGHYSGSRAVVLDAGDGSDPTLYTNHFGLSQWDGHTWSSPGHGAQGDGPNGDPGFVSRMLVYDDGTAAGRSLFVTGRIGFAGTLHANGIARWNGSQWSTLGSGLTWEFGAIGGPMAVFDDGLGGGPALFVGGQYSRAGGNPANSIAKWDGANWTALGAGMTNSYDGSPGRVRALAIFDELDGNGPALFAAGDFNQAGGQPASAIARWNGRNWTPVGGGINGTVYALAIFNDGHGQRLYACGVFTLAGGVAVNSLAKWDGQQWSDVGGGVSSQSFEPSAVAMTVFDDQLGAGPALYVGGSFTRAGNEHINSLARWNGSHWSDVGGGTVGSVYYLNVVSDQLDTPTGLYASGSFQRTGGGPYSAVARWNGRFWTDVITGSGSFVSAAAFDDNLPGAPAVYFGGLFNQVNGVNSQNIARVVPCPIDDPPRYNVCRYEVTLIDASSLCPTCPYMYGIDLNDAGTVIGKLDAHMYFSTPFEWNASTGLRPIALPTGANIGGVGGIDNHGDVAVIKGDLGYCGLGRIRINGVWSNMLPSQPNTTSWLSGINDAHQVCGYRSQADDCSLTIAFRWDNGVYTEIVPENTYNSKAYGIDANGNMVGSYRFLPGDDHAFLLTSRNQFIDLGLLPSGTRSSAVAMNSRGVIVGSANVPSPSSYFGDNRAVRWVNGVIENLGAVSGDQHSEASAVNDRGEIVGSSTGPTAGSRAFVWQNGVMRDLNALIPHHYNSVFRLESASAINNSGQILVNGSNIWEDGYVIALLTPIERLAGDINGDCQVNIDDLVLVIYEWGDANSAADVNGDGIVDIDDLVWIITHWDS